MQIVKAGSSGSETSFKGVHAYFNPDFVSNIQCPDSEGNLATILSNSLKNVPKIEFADKGGLISDSFSLLLKSPKIGAKLLPGAPTKLPNKRASSLNFYGEKIHHIFQFFMYQMRIFSTVLAFFI